MIVQINACHDVQLIPTVDDEVCVMTYEALLPFLPGIVQLNGLGHVHGRTVELDKDWPGWPRDMADRPPTAPIITIPV